MDPSSWWIPRGTDVCRTTNKQTDKQTNRQTPFAFLSVCNVGMSTYIFGCVKTVCCCQFPRTTVLSVSGKRNGSQIFCVLRHAGSPPFPIARCVLPHCHPSLSQRHQKPKRGNKTRTHTDSTKGQRGTSAKTHRHSAFPQEVQEKKRHDTTGRLQLKKTQTNTQRGEPSKRWQPFQRPCRGSRMGCRRKHTQVRTTQWILTRCRRGTVV